MPNNKIKKLISLTLAFSTILATSLPAHAANGLILPQAGNHLPTIPIAKPDIAQKSNSAFYLKNVDKKLSSTLKSNKNKVAKIDLISFNNDNGELTITKCETMNAELLKSYVSQKEDIKKITINNCPKIEASTFANCVNLKEVNIINCDSIGENAFSNCNNLNTVSITTAKNLGEAAFSGCTSLKEVTIITCKFLSESAFSGCSSLEKFEFLGGVTEPEHGKNVFNNCNSLTKVTVPSNYEMDSFCSKAVDKTGPKYTGGGGSSSQTTNNSSVSVSTPAIIASAIVAVVIASVVSVICYFKNPSSFPCLRNKNKPELLQQSFDL